MPEDRGGSGPGQTSGGDGATFNNAGKLVHPATDGTDKQSPGIPVAGGDSGKVRPKDQLPGPGGGRGASSVGVGGTGGGGGDTYGCAAGANGGHGFVAFVKT